MKKTSNYHVAYILVTLAKYRQVAQSVTSENIPSDCRMINGSGMYFLHLLPNNTSFTSQTHIYCSCVYLGYHSINHYQAQSITIRKNANLNHKNYGQVVQSERENKKRFKKDDQTAADGLSFNQKTTQQSRCKYR